MNNSILYYDIKKGAWFKSTHKIHLIYSYLRMVAGLAFDAFKD